jgi:dipeptidyl aminopeptidase/acylaminoacyl peptidase
MANMSAYSDFEPPVRISGYAAISPDGKRVAYADDSSGQFNLVVQDIDDGKPQRITSYVDSAISALFWHPDGESLIFLADTAGMENRQIYLTRLDDREPIDLTRSPDVTFDLCSQSGPFSPDRQSLAYAANDREPSDQDVLVRDLATGDVRRLYAGGGQVFSGYWSPDGRWLTAVERRGGPSEHVVYLIPADGSPVRRLTPEDATDPYWLGPWLPDGSGFLVRTTAGRDFHGLAVMSPDDGALSWLETPDWDVEDAILSADGRVLVWLVNVDGMSELRARDLASGVDLPVPALPNGEAEELTISRDGRRVGLVLATATCPDSVVVVDLEAGQLRWITEAAGAAATKMVEPALIRYPAADGTQIPAFLYRPAGDGPFGVVLAIHGGPSWQERPRYADGFFQYLCSRGVAVLAPNYRGSTGYGITYQRALNRDWGGIDLSDFADAAAWLTRQDWADAARLGLFGRSYGGFAVLSCASRLPEMNWAAAVSWCGISNLVTLGKASPPTWRSKVAAMIGDPDDDADFLTSRSPTTYADRIRTPLFVIQGANDVRVPKRESDQIVGQLRARDVEVRYDVYPDEGHLFTKHDNLTKARADAADFLLAHLGQ